MDSPEDALNDWISQADATRLRGVSPQAIAGLIQRGHLSTLKVAGRVLVRRSEVERYMPHPAGRPRKATDMPEAADAEDEV